MVAKNRGRDRDRRPHRRHSRTTNPPDHAQGAQAQPLLRDLRKALRSDDPLALLAIVSGFVEITDPRSQDPFQRDEPHADLGDLVESFIETPYAETTAALTALRALVTDEALSAEIGQELQRRRHPLPAWLTVLNQASLDPDVFFLTHVLGDGDDYLLGVNLPSGHTLSALVYVDHNMGTIVKDAFVVSQPVQDLAISLGSLIEDPDQSLTRTDPAVARAVIEAAIDRGSRLYPPIASDSWPMCRPLVEWIVRMLPAGGVVPQVKEWSDADVAEFADAFFASSFGAPLDHEPQRHLMDCVLWFGTDYGTADPMRWSPVTVEMLLVDWFPRKVLTDPDDLAKLPELLRAFIRYCHDRNGIRSSLTAETLAAVDHYEPEFLQLINSDETHARSAVVAALVEAERMSHLSVAELALESTADEVGGIDQLMRLDAEPLPDEVFDWTGIVDEIRPTVAAILRECDDCADAILDVEHRTAMRRFLAQAARNDPAPFRRKASVTRSAAAVAWVVASTNRTVGVWRSTMTNKELLGYFGITGSVSDRGRAFIRAAAFDASRMYTDQILSDPRLMTSLRRRQVIERRDRILPEIVKVGDDEARQR